MIPLRLQMKNFMGHHNSDIDFSLLSNDIVITGSEDNSNKKSNTVGKTTIFKAIAFVLFNARVSKTKNGIIRRGANKCEVVFDFKMTDGNIYRIERTRTQKSGNVNFFIRNNDQWENKTQRRNTDNDKDIEKIIGINLQTFENSLYFKQNDLFNLASATKEKRKEIIKNMLNLSIWDKWKKAAAKIKDKDETDLKIVEGKLQEYISDDPDSLQNELNELKNKLQNFVLAKNNIEAEVSTIKEDLSNKTKKLNLLKNIIDNKTKIESEYKEALLYKEESEDNYKALKEEAAKNVDKIKIINEQLSIKTTAALALNAEISKITKENVDNTPNFKRAEELETLIGTDTVKIKQLNFIIENLNKKIPQEEYCPSCSSLLDLENRNKIKEQKLIRIEKTNKDLEFLKSLKEKSQVELDKIKIQIQKHTDNINNINTYSSKLNILNNSIDAIKSELEFTTGRKQWLTSKLELAESSVKKANIEYEKAKAAKVELMKNENNNKQIQSLEDSIEYLEDTLYEYENNYQEIIGEEAVCKSKIISKEEIIGKVKQLNIKKEKLKYKLSVSSAAVLGFGSHGVPFMIISSVLDAIQNEANRVLSTLRNGTQIQFIIDDNDKDTLDIKFYVDSEEWGWEDLSGGQQGSVALALKFAMAVVNRKRCNSDVRMLMLDEVDQPLDAESVDMFYKIIQEWSKHMVIMVITHNEQLKLKFTNSIIVKKQHGISKATVVVS